MLLLSYSAFESSQWKDVRDRCTEAEFELLYQHLAKCLKVTHIAINKPIPLLDDVGQTENVLRAPRNLQPLYGDFGPTTCSSPPTRQDFEVAFWVTAKQNGIYQTWAPRWTMFSRGNISEKARLLELPSVSEAVEEGRAYGTGCAAVDLYAGIGYFAFSYLQAGVDQVLCWDLNPWSVEGLRRGAAANRWSCTAFDLHGETGWERYEGDATRLLVFSESNECATQRVQRMRNRLPPIRHVNCGLLPTSEASWQIAIDVLNPVLGGWIHVHENFGVEEIEQKAEEVRQSFQDVLHYTGLEKPVRVEDIHRLKSYAPGVMHCVLDIYVPPRDP